MKVASTNLAMQSEHRAATRRDESESLRVWRGNRPDFERVQSSIARISDTARNLLAAAPTVPRAPAPPPADTLCGEASAIESACDAVDNDPYLAMIRQMIEFFTGQEVLVFNAREFSASIGHVEARMHSTSQSLQVARPGQGGFGLEYDYHAVTEEFEQTSFSASGVIRTADGQEISFKLELEMTRHHREETNVSLRAGNAVRKDPLVINFNGTAVQLAQHAGQRFSFDLDGDGKVEMLPLFASRSGYLALDLNGNGKIDSGKELFGPQSGNGFAELAQLDSDGNGWIDAADPDFDKLSVWTPDAHGGGTVHTLADLGIGALGQRHVSTPFALRGEDNSDLGTVNSSGVYLTEDGKAGNLQEIDITI